MRLPAGQLLGLFMAGFIQFLAPRCLVEWTLALFFFFFKPAPYVKARSCGPDVKAKYSSPDVKAKSSGPRARER